MQPKGESMRDVLLKIPEVKTLLRVSVRTVWRLISCGQLPVVRVGGRSFVKRSAVEKFIERNEVTHGLGV
jgi:excisionase family DNA binding protein